MCRYCRIVAAHLLARLVAHTGDAQCAEEALPPLVALLRLQHSEGVRSPCLCASCSSGDATPPPVADLLPGDVIRCPDVTVLTQMWPSEHRRS